MSLPQEQGKYSYADYLTWPEGQRWEIIDGIACMQAAPSPRHQEILMELSKQIAVYLTGKPCKVYPAPFSVRLAENGEEKNEDIKKVVEPDITVVCDKTKIDALGCHGAPDLIVEILSPSSVKMDRLIKFNTYEKAGVKEYWLVEPEGKLVTVFILQEDLRYGRPEIYTDDDTVKVSIFSDLSIDLKPVFESV
ncbi:Restriction endonuclease type II-like [Acididesulfobacillus acetoxydans]|uniref:Endonuclease, Uma2 (Restriction endonuclease fold) n=1 Tax=Acididesulfobacillus acetoxydans TaxID=1561005 RepID=A0A8S0Y1I0_9FIRM|nr:Uma2 family endonuclease [Acididesulfobacillus acetoxydans]CAA7599495.1 Restriction endonuclease type II-like [Acididesulfobacillus acetoxydans]CEJ09276.1 Endonuclease, Uma2 (Restriction endonuclease fold) [Acididesulfobacillus acetoxydans]